MLEGWGGRESEEAKSINRKQMVFSAHGCRGTGF